MRKKIFDCVEMKRRIQEKIYEETQGLSRDAELEYFHTAATKFWEKMDSLRSENSEAAPAGTSIPSRSEVHPTTE